MFMLYGKQTMSARVDAVQPDSAAPTAGFQPGDLVVAINGRPIESFTEMQRIVSASAGETLAVTVDRDGSHARPQGHAGAERGEGQFRQRASHRHARHQPLDGGREDLKLQPVAPPRAVVLGVEETWFVIERTLGYIGGVDRRAGGGRPARRPDPHRADVRAGGDAWASSR